MCRSNVCFFPVTEVITRCDFTTRSLHRARERGLQGVLPDGDDGGGGDVHGGPAVHQDQRVGAVLLHDRSVPHRGR